jgi:hypothetical protein
MAASFTIVWVPMYSGQLYERAHDERRIWKPCFLKGLPVDMIDKAIVRYVFLMVSIITDNDSYAGLVGMARAGGTEKDEAISQCDTSSSTANSFQRRTSVEGAGGEGGARMYFSAVSVFQFLRSNPYPHISP